jgi:hypothetical protein
MIVRKTMLTAAAATLVSAPAWALPGPAASHPFGPPSSTPNNTSNPGATHRSDAADDAIEEKASDNDNGKGNGNHGSQSNGSHSGKSHKCKPHSVAYIAAATLEEGWTLNKNANGTFSGMVKVEVLHTNHHAASDKGAKKKEYTLENVHLTFAIPDANNDGSVEVDDLKAGDQVMLIGKISTLAKKCPKSGPAATPKIRQIVFHPPATS